MVVLYSAAARSGTYAADVRWTDAEVTTIGRAVLETKAAELQRKLGPLQFAAAGPVQQLPGSGFLAWHLLAPGDDTPQVTGFDVAIIRDGVIAELYMVLT